MKQEEIESTELNLNNLIDESEFLENPIGIKSPLENGKHYELFEIFNSVEGEFPKSGEFVTFVRFPICNYSCHWCFGVIPGRRVPRLKKVDDNNIHNIRLDDVSIGDSILTLDSNHNIVETKVQDVGNRDVYSWLKIKINGTLYFVTEDHPFMTTSGLKRADELIEGDLIVHINGHEVTSWAKKGDKNPMKNSDVAKRVHNIRNSKMDEIAMKTSNTRKLRIASGGIKLKLLSVEARKKISNHMKANNPMKNSDVAKKVSQTLKNKYMSGKLKPYIRTDKILNEMSLRMVGDKNPMKDPKVLEKNIKAHKWVKGKSEEIFETFMQFHDIPIKYVGDGKLLINNKMPDFIIEDTNKLIELYDSTFEYDGKFRDEAWKQSRIEFFKNEGYECICIDTHNRLSNASMLNMLPTIREYMHNGYSVESIDRVYDKKLKVYNITCAPYNTYLIDNMWVHNCDTMKNPENKPLWFKYEDIKKSVIMSEALTFTGGEASLFLSDMVDIINRLIKDNVYLKYVKVETNGSNLELMDKTFRHHFEKYFGEEYEEKFILCWSPKLMTKDYFKTAMNTINVFNPRNMVVKIVMDPNVKDKLQTFIDRFIYIHGQKGKKVFSMMPLSVVSRGNTTGQIQPDSLKLIKEYTKKGFAVGLRVHEALRVR